MRESTFLKGGFSEGLGRQKEAANQYAAYIYAGRAKVKRRSTRKAVCRAGLSQK